MSIAKGPFSLNLQSRTASGALAAFIGCVEPALERLLGLAQLNEIYQTLSADKPETEPFVRRCLKQFNISYEIQGDIPGETNLSRIPVDGPAILVANHPFGGIEGVIMADILERRRPSGKIIANFLLSRIVEMRDYFIFVDPFGSGTAVKRNRQPIRESIEHVKQGGLLTIFPSGAVSHFQFRSRQIVDPDWSQTVARIVKKTGAPVIPVYFEGANGWLFQLAGMIHPLLRTALIPRELYNKRGKTIRLRIGNPIPPKKLNGFSSDQELMSYLRLRTYILNSGVSKTTPKAGNSLVEKFSSLKSAAKCNSSRRMLPIAPPICRDEISREINSLSPNYTLIESGEYLVACAPAAEIPRTLKEIGRLREVTFRAVGEGTGKSADLDGFDKYYSHLFLWNRAQKEIAGAYRIIKTDQIIPQKGVKGLYTNTLFDYSSELLQQIGPAIELGRSFVRAEYQRSYLSLDLLWRGIGTYVARNPSNCILIGTVSISSEYDYISRQLIASFLQNNNYLPELAKLIKARNPLRRRTLRGLDEISASVVVKDLAGVSELIAEIETKHKAVPILLKQYVKLGGKFLGFNVDKNFGNVLDGLIYIDLRDTEHRLRERYIGRDQIAEFLSFHGRAGFQGRNGAATKTGTCD